MVKLHPTQILGILSSVDTHVQEVQTIGGPSAKITVGRTVRAFVRIHWDKSANVVFASEHEHVELPGLPSLLWVAKEKAANHTMVSGVPFLSEAPYVELVLELVGQWSDASLVEVASKLSELGGVLDDSWAHVFEKTHAAFVKAGKKDVGPNPGLWLGQGHPWGQPWDG